MYINGASESYRVKAESKVELGKLDPSDDSLYLGGKEHHHDELHEIREELRELQSMLYAQSKHKLLVIFQAMDTGGKDGCVNTVFGRVDPLGLRVHSFKRPTEEELAYDFLWRIHQHVPETGMISVFNRSHYEDILAVKVKKIFPESVWSKRYRHIVEFERMLADEGTKIIKIFLHISKDEQKERLQARLDEPDKNWKFNPGDLDDRARWDDFMAEYEYLIEKTSTEHAPWFIIPANKKWYRNLVVGEIVIDALKSLNMSYPKVDWDPEDIKII
jgi:PPK2 family polyphosphate:nucleotide phosphotransferase